MRIQFPVYTLLLALSCTQRPTGLSDKCKQIIESDSFYYAAPLPEMQAQYDSLWKVENFLTISTDPEIQTIDFDCIVNVNPTSKKLEELKRMEEEHFDETVRISRHHIEAIRCATESKGLRFVEATGQLIRFKAPNQTWDLDMQNDKFFDWKFILFKKSKKPKIIPNITMTLEESDNYFLTKE